MQLIVTYQSNQVSHLFEKVAQEAILEYYALEYLYIRSLSYGYNCRCSNAADGNLT